MSIILRQVYFSDNNSRSIQRIQDSIGWNDPVKGEGIEAYSSATKKVVGYIAINKEDDHIFLNHIAVHQQHQSEGIGTILFKEVCAIAQKEEFPVVSLYSTSKKTNDFYRSMANKLNCSFENEPDNSFSVPDGPSHFKFFINEMTSPINKMSRSVPLSQFSFPFYTF